ncbi:3-methylcrotonyl-CoA carboxylase subunit alpha [Vitreoscilla filiformis]|uniref:3-methylcrotonyl-CoA carboxylase subunit alpha n=1 Tax=Vitreoscilla filiformis TaxID=63 RepID=A0A221KIH4_VITFI|nr:biotin carboxylase N-terminal domain-containing protein [Vitreoscilla filiformis]ASM78600.1 3-methylcrotonyl-CoA carboxylase subunit alpha [Vitreoscilla filiformis]
MFKKILIANRGEIACRVAATARRLGVSTVAVYSDADAHAQHVVACDEAVPLGGLSAQDSYLRWERILAAAQATGAEAIHPGYGFLSENEAFARACAEAGLVFIGPPPGAIAAMGSKAAAKALMSQAGVPLVPGYHGENNDPAFLLGEAQRIGFPVLIKASAGGGGRGMRRVDRAEDFLAALASCQREAQASFGSAHVLVERYVTRPRHIEIQVFADGRGNCIHLGERDCSVQRRHQKVLEEAPAPGLSAELRAEMGAAAVAAARAVGYVGAGTVEFIAEQPEGEALRFYFMEMNTRLQVEHPVTEAITGFDLVAWQLRVASGEALPVTQDAVRLTGHAIEARICAENPDAGFLPATGTLSVLRWPAHVRFVRNAEQLAHLPPAAVRVDAGVVEGDAISPHYDSMVAKLIVWGEDREQALARLAAALRETHIVGLNTNVAFLRRVVASRSFAGADLDTALIERERAALFEAPGVSAELAAAGLIAHTLATEARQQAADPWTRRDGWRLHGVARRRFDLVQGDVRWQVYLERGAAAAPSPQPLSHEGRGALSGAQGVAPGTPGIPSAPVLPPLPSWERAGERGKPRLHLHLPDGRHLPFQAEDLGAERFALTLAGQRHTVSVHRAGDKVTVFAEAGLAELREFDALAHAGDGAHAGGLTAPMPGKVLAYLVAEGDTVAAGQPVAVMEAMKMEHTLSAPRAGTVAELRFGVGQQVSEGAELLTLE